MNYKTFINLSEKILSIIFIISPLCQYFMNRGLINMSAESQKDSTRHFLTVDDAVHLQKSRTGTYFPFSKYITENIRFTSINKQNGVDI